MHDGIGTRGPQLFRSLRITQGIAACSLLLGMSAYAQVPTSLVPTPLTGEARMVTFDFDDDRINVSAYNRFDSFADVRGAARQVGDDVIITHGTDRLVIEDTRLQNLGSEDFIY